MWCSPKNIGAAACCGSIRVSAFTYTCRCSSRYMIIVYYLVGSCSTFTRAEMSSGHLALFYGKCFSRRRECSWVYCSYSCVTVYSGAYLNAWYKCCFVRYFGYRFWIAPTSCIYELDLVTGLNFSVQLLWLYNIIYTICSLKVLLNCIDDSFYIRY